MFTACLSSQVGDPPKSLGTFCVHLWILRTHGNNWMLEPFLWVRNIVPKTMLPDICYVTSGKKIPSDDSCDAQELVQGLAHSRMIDMNESSSQMKHESTVWLPECWMPLLFQKLNRGHAQRAYLLQGTFRKCIFHAGSRNLRITF